VLDVLVFRVAFFFHLAEACDLDSAQLLLLLVLLYFVHGPPEPQLGTQLGCWGISWRVVLLEEKNDVLECASRTFTYSDQLLLFLILSEAIEDLLSVLCSLLGPLCLLTSRGLVQDTPRGLV